MKTCQKCREAKPLSAFSKCAARKDGLQAHCKPCKLAYQKANPRRVDVTKRYYAANREVCKARTMASVAKRRDYYNARVAAWAAQSPTHLQRRREWYAANSATEIAKVRRRQERIRNIDHLSLGEQAEIQGLYDFCRIFKGFEVDHDIPLNGKLVSGLHVPSNLQVLTVRANRQKGATWSQDGQH